MQTLLGRKRKHDREDNFRCVREDFRHQRTRGEEDSSEMSQTAEVTLDEEDSNNVDQSVEGTRGEEELNQMDQSDKPIDRISLMPDHVIHRILSSLRNMKDVVRTSVLSKRWRSLWYSFTTIKAIEVVDKCLNIVTETISSVGGTAVIVADHGNAEQ
ncbi:MAG: hypothetical protein Q8765_02560, partial [Sweet potato little leaf phytoplasma]|nr:hypothetical protein [Sweet potato little leaf phytoplasma]